MRSIYTGPLLHKKEISFVFQAGNVVYDRCFTEIRNSSTRRGDPAPRADWGLKSHQENAVVSTQLLMCILFTTSPCLLFFHSVFSSLDKTSKYTGPNRMSCRPTGKLIDTYMANLLLTQPDLSNRLLYRVWHTPKNRDCIDPVRALTLLFDHSSWYAKS